MSRTYYTHMMLWVFRRIIDITVPVSDMHSNPIRPSALTFLALASIYILPPYVPICSLASCFIYHTHIDIASVPVLTVALFFAEEKGERIHPFQHWVSYSGGAHSAFMNSNSPRKLNIGILL